MWPTSLILERFIAANNVTGNICDFTRCDTFPCSCLSNRLVLIRVAKIYRLHYKMKVVTKKQMHERI